MDKVDKAQIEEIKSAIQSQYEAKIKKLRDEMIDALSSLSRVEKTLIGETSSQNSGDREDVRYIKVAKKKPPKVSTFKTDKSEKQRFMAALQEIDQDFSTGEFKEKINNDGNGNEIKRGTFAGLFAKLIKEGKLIVVQERKGNQGGVYRKGDYWKTVRSANE